MSGRKIEKGPRLSRRDLTLGALASIAVSASGPAALAQDTARPRRILVPAAPGGPQDVLTRLIAGLLNQRFGDTMVVENRAGAVGKLAALGVKTAPPDGFTLGMFNSTMAYAEAVMTDPGFSLTQDFTPIAHLTSMNIALVSRPSFPAKTLPELATFARANPNKVSCGSIAPPLVAYLKAAAKMDLNTIPYRGGALALQALIAGEVDTILTVLQEIIPHIESGTVWPIAIGAPKRLPKLPDVGVFEETLPGIDMRTWYGLFAPLGISDSAAGELRSKVAAVVEMPEFKAYCEARYLNPPVSLATFTGMVSDEVVLWHKLVTDLKLQRI
ncbi:MAG: Bug family tripartite tricarboxylate transporter substrate binding protein [Pseudorhodoplanes sp.]|uniref:Bug family tripartite tricarboxylate transporter substrate binding protein n=1 Tax=Pseudorhodoplanes sp. TaxID=1934341 RepID=UPI003D14EE7F